MKKLLRKIIKFFSVKPPYGAKCPHCSSSDIADSSDGYHWKCNSCGKTFSNIEMQY